MGLARWDQKTFSVNCCIVVHKFVVSLQEGDFIAKFNPKWIRKFDDMQENLTNSHKAQVCDSRPPATFNHSLDGTVEKLY